MKIILSLLVLMLFAQSATAQYTGSRPDGHAPIGVMGDHTHGIGEFMFSYRYMYMAMEGSRVGTSSIADTDVVSPDGENFLISPTKMPMQMHMLGMMYAPTSKITLMAMLPVLSSNMDHLARNGNTFSTSSSGIGDISIGALWQFHKGESARTHANLSVRIPTGSIEAMDVTPTSSPNEAVLPYPMQLGSGTTDFEPGITELAQFGEWSYGAQGKYLFRLGENSSDYKLGNKLTVNAWGARKLTDAISGSFRAEFQSLGDINGANLAFAGAVENRMVPTVFTELRAGKRVDLFLGSNVYLPKSSALAGLRFAIEVGIPVYQDLDGPQLETDLTLVTGIQYAL